MIEYIINKQNQADIYQTDDVLCVNKTNLSVIKQLCIKQLFTYEGYLKAIKHVFKYGYRIPVYINPQMMMFATKNVRDYDNVWINFVSIISIKFIGNRVILGFTSGRELEVHMSKHNLNLQIKRLQAIKFHISKHFHSVDYRK